MFQKNPKEKSSDTVDMAFGKPRRRSSSVSIYKPDKMTSPVVRQRRRSSSISVQAKLSAEGAPSPLSGAYKRRGSNVSLSADGLSSPMGSGYRRRSSSMSLHDLTKNVHNIEQLQMLHAVYQDDTDQVWELLSSGSDPNLIGSEGSPLLHIAVESGNEEMVKVLLSSEKCKVNIEDVFGQTPMMKATIFDDVTIMKILHKAGANLDSVDKTGRTALLSCLQDGKSQAARYLIKHGCDVNIVDDFGQSALFQTINNKQPNCVKTVQRLMKAGYKLDKDKKWMEEDGFDVRIIHTRGLCTKLLGKFRSRMNKIKSDRSASSGVRRRVLTIYD
ncbi:unnamed protein product [Mytilus coruscus]|uniref:Uncharacterized protein n=1 Tax=Mytilus coruscus TaxID=42192 RepID=A0A6J8DLA8_MYTCO|nr:unnamed protein product [Mytilus coruscus]